MLYWCAYAENTSLVYLGTGRVNLVRLLNMRPNVKYLTFSSERVMTPYYIYRIAVQIMQGKLTAPDRTEYNTLHYAADVIVQKSTLDMDKIKLVFECELSYHLLDDPIDVLNSLQNHTWKHVANCTKRICTLSGVLQWLHV